MSIHPKLPLLHLFTLCISVAACEGADPGPAPDAGPRADGATMDCDANGIVVSGSIGADTTWACPVYVLDGIVYVVEDATLTISPGVQVLGDTGRSEVSALVVTRGAQLVANGTAEAPVVFTSGNPPGARATGDWAGIALLGSARTNDGNCVDGADDSCAGGFLEDRLEGLDVSDRRAVYGGDDDAGSCGTLRYTRIEFAGRELSPDNELNGLTLAACGATTRLSYVQIHRAKDDGLELFGGTASFDHLIVTGASDDSLDFDEGWRGNGQFIVLHQFPGIGDRGIEADNLGSSEAAEPRTEPSLANLTLLGEAEHQFALIREGALGRFVNMLVSGHGGALDIRARTADPGPAWPERLVVEHSALFGVAAFASEDLDSGGVCAVAQSRWSGSSAWPAECESLDQTQTQHYDAIATDRLDDDLGLDEAALFAAPARGNFVSELDPGFNSRSTTAPSYVPTAPDLHNGATPRFTEFAPDDFGDVDAAYIGAFEPGGEDWASGWTSFPER